MVATLLLFLLIVHLAVIVLLLFCCCEFVVPKVVLRCGCCLVAALPHNERKNELF